MIVQTLCGNNIKLVNRTVRQFAKEFNTLLSGTFHVVAPSCDVFEILPLSFDISICADQLQEQFLSFPPQCCYSLVLLAEYIQDIPDQ